MLQFFEPVEIFDQFILFLMADFKQITTQEIFLDYF